MSLKESINKIISKLDEKWFTTVKAEFESNPFYNNESKMIDDAIEEYDILSDPYDETTNEKEEKEEKDDKVRTLLIRSTLPEYSWKRLPIRLTNINPEEDAIFEASSLTEEVIFAVDELFSSMTGIRDKHQLIVTAVKYIQEEASTLKSKANDSEYSECIDYCVLQFRYKLSQKYGVIKRAHDTIGEFEDRLVFELKQKELAFLLAVLNRAGFLEGANEKGSTINHFFSKFFYFKNQRESNSFTRATSIGKKISEAMSSGNGDYVSIKPDIKKRLMDAINSL